MQLRTTRRRPSIMIALPSSTRAVFYKTHVPHPTHRRSSFLFIPRGGVPSKLKAFSKQETIMLQDRDNCVQRSARTAQSRPHLVLTNRVMLRPMSMSTVVGIAAVTVMRCPTVAAFVRPAAVRSASRHVTRSTQVSSSVSIRSTFKAPTVTTIN